MSNYSIKDLERLSGIKAHTIRIWEKRYGLIDPQRSETNIRSYCDSDLKKLLNVSILNRNGLKISKISQLSNPEILNLVAKLTDDTHDADSQFESLYISMIDLDESLFDKIISRAIIQRGFERMIIELIYPFLKKVGVMWQTGSISPAQEHFISNLIRQKLLVAIDSIVLNEEQNSKRFILYLHEHEQHELGLLFIYYLLKKRNQKVIYLGAILPFEDLKAIVKLKPADYIVTSFVTSMENNKLREYLDKISKELSDEQFLISGQQSESINNTTGKIKILPTIDLFIREIDSVIKGS